MLSLCKKEGIHTAVESSLFLWEEEVFSLVDLVVRVTGFTAYFSSLSPDFRKLVVDRFLKGM